MGGDIQALGGELKRQADEERAKQNAVDIARAEALKTEGFLNTQNEFDNDPDYSTYQKRVPAKTGEIVKNAANVIRDPEMRERWQIGAQTDSLRVNDSIFDRGTTLRRQTEVVAFDDALETNRRIYVDPTTPEEAKAKAKADIDGAIKTGLATGLLTPEAADARRKTFIEDAEFIRGKLEVENNPAVVSTARIASGPTGQIIADAATRHGVSPEALLKVAVIESGGNPNAKNPRSSAGGLFQFIDSTARQYGLTNKFDAAQAADAAARLMKDNAAHLRKTLGREPSAGELYLAHQQGAGGAAKLLANPDRLAVDVLGWDAVRLNGGAPGMTAGQFAAKWTSKADGVSASVPGWYNALSPEQRQVVLDQADARQRAIDTEATAQQKADYDNYRDTVGLNILTGGVTSERTILDDPMLQPGDKSTLLRSFRTQMEDTLATAAAIQQFAVGGLSVNPYDEKGRKTVDNVDAALVKTLPPEQLQSEREDLVRQSGVVPKSLMSAIRQGLESTNIADVIAAAQQAQRLSAINPAALSRRDGGTAVQNAADDFSYFVNNLNLPVEQAAQRLMDERDPTKKLARKAIEPAAKEFLKTMESSNLANEFDTLFGSGPSLGFTPGQQLGIQAEFMAIAEDQFYAANGDPEIAKNRAVEQMKRLYGVTELTGRKVLMKHPPERYWPSFPIAEAATSLSYPAQLEDDLREFSPNVDMGTVQLVTTPETDAMVKRGEMPGYAIIYQDENGVLQTIPGKLWKPDISALQKMQGSVDAAEQSARENAARAEQKQQRQQAPYRVQTPEDFMSGNDPVFGERGEPAPLAGPGAVDPKAPPVPDDIGSEIMVIP